LPTDPSLVRAAFEEAVCYESPVQTFFRTRPVEIGGIAIDVAKRSSQYVARARQTASEIAISLKG
jgi:hypothetical protein